ncbi:unnamed protein product [Boreogadus saida]
MTCHIKPLRRAEGTRLLASRGLTAERSIKVVEVMVEVMVEVVSVVVLVVLVVVVVVAGEEAACGGPLNHSVNGKDAAVSGGWMGSGVSDASRCDGVISRKGLDVPTHHGS